ncbi:high-affinity nitrate transporter 3.1-like [Rosa chinensis]|uniref:high-affinity nitrate transporter 3.1-like n=1 Tax=Rosa chinensis TaxID=74649 RepID=UPI001AD8A0FF|nr:high-affinity nitrate transporter 3.1-like [Rosa chinensis]
MASRSEIVLASLLLFLSCLAETSDANGVVLFSSLPNTLEMIVSPHKPEQVMKPAEGSWTFGGTLKAGEDKLSISWRLNQSFSAGTTDSGYKTIKVKLCYAPVSQVDRGWRKTVDNLAKDKTCQFKIETRPYKHVCDSFYTQCTHRLVLPCGLEGGSASKWKYIDWTIKRDVPSASYFVRAYAYDGAGVAVAYGQSTGPKKNYNIFEVQGITGRHKTLDVVSICFSAFSVLSLVGFFVVEKTRAKPT